MNMELGVCDLPPDTADLVTRVMMWVIGMNQSFSQSGNLVIPVTLAISLTLREGLRSVVFEKYKRAMKNYFMAKRTEMYNATMPLYCRQDGV